MNNSDPVCVICDSHEVHPAYTKFGLTIGRCTCCGFLFSHPRAATDVIRRRYSPEYFWNEYLPSLGVHEGLYELDFFIRRFVPMVQLIARDIQPPGRLLEIGVGAGFFLKVAERAGWKVTGIDISGQAVTFARERLHLDVTTESAETMSFPAGTFDVVVMFEVIEHVLDALRVLQSVKRTLRSGGLLVLSTPNYDALSRLGLGREWAVLSPAEHLSYFSETTLRRLLHRVGMADVRFERSFPGFGVFETMNPRSTHAPRSLRTRTYSTCVRLLGPLSFRLVQKWGRGDTLLCLARSR